MLGIGAEPRVLPCRQKSVPWHATAEQSMKNTNHDHLQQNSLHYGCKVSGGAVLCPGNLLIHQEQDGR